MYEEDWKQYRKYRREFWIVFVGYVPVMSVVAILSNWLFHSFMPAFVLTAAYMLLFIVAGIRVNSFYCPRCQLVCREMVVQPRISRAKMPALWPAQVQP
jgi:hypothetical protein